MRRTSWHAHMPRGSASVRLLGLRGQLPLGQASPRWLGVSLIQGVCWGLARTLHSLGPPPASCHSQDFVTLGPPSPERSWICRSPLATFALYLFALVRGQVWTVGSTGESRRENGEGGIERTKRRVLVKEGMASRPLPPRSGGCSLSCEIWESP